MWLWGGDQALGYKGLCVCLRRKENAPNQEDTAKPPVHVLSEMQALNTASLLQI